MAKSTTVDQVLVAVGDRARGQDLLSLPIAIRLPVKVRKPSSVSTISATMTKPRARCRRAAAAGRYSAVPTSAAASAPQACDMAVRCGTAVIGMMYAIGTPTADADEERRQNPLPVVDVVLEQRADDRQQHAELRPRRRRGAR